MVAATVGKYPDNPTYRHIYLVRKVQWLGRLSPDSNQGLLVFRDRATS